MYPSQLNIAIGADLLAQGVCSTIIGIADTVITYTRYKLLVERKSFVTMDIFVGIYMFLFLIASTLPFYTVLPLFEDTNDGPGLEALSMCLYYVYSPGFALFNLTFSFVFLKKIFTFGSTKVECHPKLLKLAYKSAFHSFTRYPFFIICCNPLRLYNMLID